MVRILVTGSRAWNDAWVIADALAEHIPTNDAGWLANRDVTVVHGACETGADAIADELARAWNLRRDRHPADWLACAPDCPPPAEHRRVRRGGSTYCPGAGPRRNQAMVALGADICLGFPLGRSTGTRDCLRRAQAAGIPLRVFEGRVAA